MKKTQKALILLLCGTLCVFILTCASSGGSSAGGDAGEVVAGTWTWKGYTPADKGDGDTSICSVVIAEEVINGETVTTYSLSGTVTNAIQYGLAECDIVPDEATLELLKTAKAVSFKVMGDGKRYNLEAPISTVTDWGFHVFGFEASTEATEYVVQMRMFMQPAWAAQVRFNQARITKLIFKTRNQAEGGLGDFSVKIWDLKLHM
jgi:hypothetical protein